MINGIIVVVVIMVIMIIKYIIWTINVHKHNIIVKERLGENTYNWLIYQNDIPHPLKTLDKEINELLLKQSGMNNALIKLNNSLKSFGEALSVIKVKEDLWQM